MEVDASHVVLALAAVGGWLAFLVSAFVKRAPGPVDEVLDDQVNRAIEAIQLEVAAMLHDREVSSDEINVLLRDIDRAYKLHVESVTSGRTHRDPS